MFRQVGQDFVPALKAGHQIFLTFPIAHHTQTNTSQFDMVQVPGARRPDQRLLRHVSAKKHFQPGTVL